ncbi:hypothetical protein FNV43_RR00153 [Rhamnella rubrinervis]|uniref:R13L1/DRL21-like LRR repeat region domain-containing protein n=1 Tax=Rhamnella rubrinervis TaxID=2594499 RepID=A0A8K0HMC7_9ROSA|nr:hypothetical protein FNV43_RR00153 [Rhamnella rubrinervis]
MEYRIVNPQQLQSMQYLRVLSADSFIFEDYFPKKFSKSVASLKLLRFLDLSSTGIEEIPDTIFRPYNLQTLLLRECRNLAKLPDSIGNLKHLNGEGVSKANLKDRKCIRALCLSWEGVNDDSDNKAREVLDRLQPHTNIEKLYIINYGGRSFPDWVGHHSFCRIESVSLDVLTNCHQLPPLGQLPSLKSLEIRGLDKLENLGDEFYSSGSSSSSSGVGVTETRPPFKSLEILEFSRMPQWEEWSWVGRAFSNLKALELVDCPKLNGACLPECLQSLTELRISSTSPDVPV